jgi:MraZ protein
MSPFVGPFSAKVDPKNRLNLPVKLRQASEDSLDVCYLALGLDGCLFLLSRSEWQQVMAKFDNYGLANENANFFMRKLMANTAEVSPDRQNRIIIPPKLATLAGITDEKRDVTILGMNRRIEIWEVGRFETYIEGFGQTYEEVARKLLL